MKSSSVSNFDLEVCSYLGNAIFIMYVVLLYISGTQGFSIFCSPTARALIWSGLFEGLDHS